MARLLYIPIMSLDGYVADETGNFDWAMPDDGVFGFVNDFERPVGTYLYGRRLYQDMTGCGSTCWTSAGSATGWSTFITVS